MIGIIGALGIETAELSAAMTERQSERIAGMEFVSGKLEGKDAVIATCGPGKVFAAACAQAMILRYSPTLVINSGVAGSLSPKLHIGDVAIAERVCQHDMDTSACGDPVGMVSVVNMTYFPCDARAVSAAEKAARDRGLNYQTGIIATGDRFIASTEDKRRITERFHAISCEMEGGAVGHTCYINGVPFFVLRVMSDEADGGAPDNFEEYARFAADKSTAVIKSIIKEI